MIVGAHSFPVTGDGEHNFTTICAAAERAAEAGAELLLFPECALTGYPPRDIPSSSAVDFPRLAEMHAALHKLSGALDSRAARLLLQSFERLNSNLGATIMMVTHDAFTASYCKRILFIKDGRVFNELIRGEMDRKTFFERIIEVVTLLGGDMSNVL